MKLGRPPTASLVPIAIIGIRHVPLAAIGKLTPIFGIRGRGLRPHFADAVVGNLLQLQIPAHRGQSFRRIADSVPVIADSF
jgi:hypothetical protein